MRIARSMLTVLMVTVSLAGTASAHSFYELECCSGRDCKPVSDDEVRPTKEGWLVKTTGEVIKYNSWPVKHSPDGRFHRCAGLGNFGPKGRTQCLYVPDFGE